MNDLSIPSRDSALGALSRDIVDASDRQIIRIVAMVDALTTRGPADQLLVPLRRQQRTARVPRPLRFKRLLFAPLDQLIVPAERWLPGQPTIPRTALTTLADHVREAMGSEVDEISAGIAGKTNADLDVIARLGRPLWPKAARILTEARIPQTWGTTGLSNAIYRPLASIIAALLQQAAPLDVLCSETVDRLLPPRPEAIAAILSQTAASKPVALPMLIALMLLRLPQAAASIRSEYLGKQAAVIRAALDQAADQLLRHLGEEKTTESRIAAGTLAEACGEVRRIIMLLEQFRGDMGKPLRREQMVTVRQRLDAGCRKRFSSGMQHDFLTPLQRLDVEPTATHIQALETAARGLRMLEIEARGIGSSSTYDLLLSKATEAVKAEILHHRLTPMDRMRLMEILAGTDAALALRDQCG